MSDKPICARCKLPKPNMSLEPSRSQLLFGGFKVRLEYRCTECEREVTAWVNRVLEKNK